MLAASDELRGQMYAFSQQLLRPRRPAGGQTGGDCRQTPPAARIPPGCGRPCDADDCTPCFRDPASRVAPPVRVTACVTHGTRHGPDHQRARAPAAAGRPHLRSELHRGRPDLRDPARRGRLARAAASRCRCSPLLTLAQIRMGMSRSLIWVGARARRAASRIIGVFRYVGAGPSPEAGYAVDHRARRRIASPPCAIVLTSSAPRIVLLVAAFLVDRRRGRLRLRRRPAHAAHRRGRRARLAAADRDRDLDQRRRSAGREAHRQHRPRAPRRAAGERARGAAPPVGPSAARHRARHPHAARPLGRRREAARRCASRPATTPACCASCGWARTRRRPPRASRSSRPRPRRSR